MASTIQHPTETNLRGLLWFGTGRLLVTVGDVLMILVIAAVMQSRGSNLMTLCLVTLAGLVVLRVARKFAFRLAWAEVPGAFAVRLLERGDRLETERPKVADVVAQTVSAAVLVAGAVFLARYVDADADLRAATVGLLGGAGLGYCLATAVAGFFTRPHEHWTVRFVLINMATWAAWIVVAAEFAPGAREGVAVGYAKIGLVNMLLVLAVVWAFRMVFRTFKTPETVSPSSEALDREFAVLRQHARPVEDAEAQDSEEERKGWWATWVHYLPLTLTMVGGTAIFQATLGGGTWVGAALTLGVGLLVSMIVLPLADRLANPPLRRDDEA